MGKTQIILDFVSCGRPGPGGPGKTQGGDTNHDRFCVLCSARLQGPGKDTRGKTRIMLDFVSCGRPGPGGPGKTQGGGHKS